MDGYARQEAGEMRLHANIRGRAADTELGEIPHAVGALTRPDDIQVRPEIAHQLGQLNDAEHILLGHGPRRPERLRRDDTAGVRG